MSKGYFVYDFMIDGLKLRDKTLLVFAVIHSFTISREGEFRGSRAYLAQRITATTRCVDYALSELIEKGYITKTEASAKNGCPVYRTSDKVLKTYPEVRNDFAKERNDCTGGAKIFLSGGEMIAPSNKEDNKVDNKAIYPRTRREQRSRTKIGYGIKAEDGFDVYDLDAIIARKGTQREE